MSHLRPCFLAITLLFITPFFSLGYSKVIEHPEETITAHGLEILLGEWTGSLTYIDYSTNKPYTMPANLVVKRGKKENQLVLFNIFPNEPKANNQDKLIVSKNGNQLNKKDIESIERLLNSRTQIITEFVGKDNKKNATIRNIFILADKQFVIRKEVQFENTRE